MEKMKVEAEAPVLMQREELIVDTAEGKQEIPMNDWHPVEEVNPKGTKWIKNQYDFTKTCESCGAVMRGWAYREPFKYCPKCGAMAEQEA